VISVLIRQLGLLLPLAFGLVLFLKNRHSFKNMAVVLSPVIITGASLYLFTFWLRNQQSLPPDFGTIPVVLQNIFHRFFYFLWEKLGFIVFYIVAISFPLILFNLTELWKSSSLKLKITTFSVFGVLLIFVHNIFYSLPIQNIAGNFFIGPKLLKDTYNDFTGIYKLPKDLINVVNLVILVLFIPFLLKVFGNTARALQSLKHKTGNPNEYIYLTFLLFITLYSIFLIFNPMLFDRYFLPLYPFILALVIPDKDFDIPGKVKSFVKVFIIGVALFSIAGTHDYYSWSRARWMATTYLTDEKKIPASMIDGGFEFNGWNARQHLKRNYGTPYSRSFWFVEDDQYLVAFDTFNCYCKVKGFPFSTILPSKQDSVFILSRKPLNHGTTTRCDMESLTADKRFFYCADSLLYFDYTGRVSMEQKHSGKSSVQLTNSTKSWICIRLHDFKPCEKVIVTVWRYPGNSKAGINIKSDFNINFDYFISENIVQQDPSGWSMIQAELTIPAGFGNHELEFCILNRGNATCWIDDFELIRLKP
jgi:hypothetical protein